MQKNKIRCAGEIETTFTPPKDSVAPASDLMARISVLEEEKKALKSALMVSKHAENALKKANDELENRVSERTRELEEANIALKVMLRKRDEDKSEIEQNMLHNVKELVMPYVEKLKAAQLQGRQKVDLSILEMNLNKITSHFVHKLTARYTKLTPTEVQVANFIKFGKTSKEIAEIMCMSKKTIDIHRYNIRKKLGLQNKKINLRMYLSSFK